MYGCRPNFTGYDSNPFFPASSFIFRANLSDEGDDGYDLLSGVYFFSL